MIGSGYVGLVSGACLADFGHHITCVDKSEAKIDALERGEVPIFEPGLDAIIEHNRAAGRLDFYNDLAAPVAAADVVFIAVGTPSRRGDGHADLSYVYAAAREIAAAVTGFTVVVTKSTVPVGTGDEIERIFREEFPGKDIAVVSNPEFLREGAAITDFKRPDRIVIGTEDARATEVMREVYRPLYLNEAPLYFCERRTSELIKYAANAFLAMKITFINEVADLCEKVDADVQQVAKGIGLDNRIGSKFLHAGPGYGGSCFPKDTLALVHTAEDAGAPLRLVQTTVEVNAARKKQMAERVIEALGGDATGKTVCLLGVAFKPNTDDMRDAPSLDVAPALIAAGATVQAFDPEAMHEAKKLLPDVVFKTGPYEAVEGADVVVILTEWDQFRALDLKRVKDLANQAIIVDLRNVYRPEDVRAMGFAYSSIGRA